MKCIIELSKFNLFGHSFCLLLAAVKQVFINLQQIMWEIANQLFAFRGGNFFLWKNSDGAKIILYAVDIIAT